MSTPRIHGRRALFIVFHYPPSTSVGTQRTVRFQRYLPDFGWHADILAPSASEFSRQSVTPAGEMILRAPVWRPLRRAVRMRRWLTTGAAGRRQRSDGGPAAVPPPSSREHLARVRGWFEFPDEQIGWYPRAVLAGWRHIRSVKPAVLYTSGPPHSSHLIALSLKRLTGLPWVADFRDPWSRRPWMAPEERVGSRYRALVSLERTIVHAADRVVLNTPEMASEFIAHYALDGAKFTAISNGYDPHLLARVDPGPGLPPRPFVFTHAGSLYRRRDPTALLDAMAMLRDRGRIAPGTFLLRLVGFVDPQFDVSAGIRARTLGEMVELTGTVSHARSLHYLAASHCLVLLQPGTALQVPGKLFEYLAFGKPILTLAPPGATTAIVQNHGLGRVADPLDAAAIARTLEELLADFEGGSRRSIDASGALAQYDGRHLTGALARLFDELTQA